MLCSIWEKSRVPLNRDFDLAWQSQCSRHAVSSWEFFLALYAAGPRAFSEEHQRVLEAVANRIAPAINRALGERRAKGPRPAGRDDGSKIHSLQVCVALLEITGESVASIEEAVAQIRPRLKPGDSAFRRNDTIVLLLHATGRAWAERFVDDLVSEAADADRPFAIRYVLACAPDDGHDVEDLLKQSEALRSTNRLASKGDSVH
jgi:hypothetical protein